MEMLIIFIVLTILNVVIQTIKSIATIKCGKWAAALVNAVAYGLYTYADFSDYISEAAYNSSPAVYLKVAVGKGMLTYEEILDVIEYLLAGSLIQ